MTEIRERAKPVTLTDAAARQVGRIIAKATEPTKGLWIGVGEGGCSGKTYKMDYAKDIKPSDMVIEDKGVTIIIDALASLYIFGTVIDYEDTPLKSGFTFTNPNETGRCGCGESFSV
jgi:iron-sulfur cluster assembly protein